MPRLGHLYCVLKQRWFLGKTLYSHNASLHPGVLVGTDKLSGKPHKTTRWGGGGGVTCDGLASHPGGVAIFLVASCHRNWDKLWQ